MAITLGLLTAAGTSPSLATTPAANATGINVRLPFAKVAISGRITQAAGGSAANVAVIALDQNGHRVADALANAAGRYNLVTLPHGQYRLAVDPGESGAPTLQSGFLRTSAPGHFTDRLSRASVLNYTGSKLAGRNVTLPTGYTISGTITKAATSTGVENAQVTAHTSAPGATLFGESSTATDATGHYEFVGLGRGAYTLEVMHPFFSTANVQSGCFRSSAPGHFVRDCSAASVLTISSASLTGKDVALPDGLVIKGGVKDRTVDANDLCAAIYVYNHGTHEIDGFSSQCGDFRIDGLAATDYDVFVSPEFVALFIEGYYSPSNAEQWVPPTASPPALHLAADMDLGVIKPDAGHSISGHVYDPAGNPLQNATVQTLSPDGTKVFHSAETAADGSFTVMGLADRRYILSVRKTFYNLQAGWYSAGRPNEFTTRRSQATRIMVAATDVTGIDLRMPAGYTISGLAKDPTGHAIRVNVAAVGPGAPSYGYSTGPDGTYTLTDYPPGDYKVSFSAVPTGGRALRSGWYSATRPGHFTSSKAQATAVHVGP
jgi:protocatechuate 3,4-dioxygenase beta subunit